MFEVRSAGLIIYRLRNNEIEYLMLQKPKLPRIHNWAPPKGRLNQGEDPLSGAIRETEEETGLKESENYKLTDLSKTIEFIHPKKEKRIFYWIAQVFDPNVTIKLSNEHINFRWLNIGEALKTCQLEKTEKILIEANNLINSYTNFKFF